MRFTNYKTGIKIRRNRDEISDLGHGKLPGFWGLMFHVLFRERWQPRNILATKLNFISFRSLKICAGFERSRPHPAFDTTSAFSDFLPMVMLLFAEQARMTPV